MNEADYDKLCGNLLETLKQYRRDYIEKEPKEEETFSIGDIIWIKYLCDHYLLAAVDDNAIIPVHINTEERGCVLERGRRWNNVIPVKDMHAITWDELNQDIKSTFGLVGLNIED